MAEAFAPAQRALRSNSVPACVSARGPSRAPAASSIAASTVRCRANTTTAAEQKPRQPQGLPIRSPGKSCLRKCSGSSATSSNSKRCSTVTVNLQSTQTTPCATGSNSEDPSVLQLPFDPSLLGPLDCTMPATVVAARGWNKDGADSDEEVVSSDSPNTGADLGSGNSRTRELISALATTFEQRHRKAQTETARSQKLQQELVATRHLLTQCVADRQAAERRCADLERQLSLAEERADQERRARHTREQQFALELQAVKHAAITTHSQIEAANTGLEAEVARRDSRICQLEAAVRELERLAARQAQRLDEADLLRKELLVAHAQAQRRCDTQGRELLDLHEDLKSTLERFLSPESRTAKRC